ncbi:helix-turn-helix domain-containing protein [Gilvimarinus xylanilyticus]|uniref:Helix-turn-helix domain-containing protein n=1 Tax=Gilvimarinus xylanilyticus TaxID=2944139 RepID=A0A9X2I032_9GAMM|nr:helix-turn-helix domain-containing protein [Gilvimarinus xylanilyticus]MCP8900949.1 helix-turn-helix domain-containing protein [Gilvimarinus xylanilyticus]
MNTLKARLPTPEEAAIAKKSSRELEALLSTSSEIQAMSITDTNGVLHSITLPVSSLRLLVSALEEIGEGNAVNLLPVRAELSTQEAADLLNIPRKAMIKLMDEEQIPHVLNGNTLKVRYLDLVAYQSKLQSDRLADLRELSKADQKLGLGYY